MLRSFCLAALGGAAVVACGAQADTSYKGEALAELSGIVENSQSSAPPAPLDAALLWDGYGLGSVDGKVVPGPYRKIPGTTVPVSGAFPAKFVLKIFTPPPSAALFSCFFRSDSTRPGMAASASLSAILHGSSTVDLDITDLYGSVDEYMIVYADNDLPADNDCKLGALPKGYHLFHYEPLPDKPGCVPQGIDDTSCHADGLPYVEVPMSTPLTLRLWHEDGKATPPSNPSASPPPAGDNTANQEDAPPSGG